MLRFPEVPTWWEKGSKFMRLNKGFEEPIDIVGYDTESCKGEIITQQFISHNEIQLRWVSSKNAMDEFFDFLDKLPIGFIVMYCFNAKFDLAITFRKFLDEFLADDFEIKDYNGWRIKVFCSRNWHATFTKGKKTVRFLDITAFFSGTLDKVSKSFGFENLAKLKRPKALGYIKFSPGDKEFEDYAMMDARLCYEMGKVIIGMHGEFDIPLASSSANFAEKVFRRKFFSGKERLAFPPFRARRYAEITYHGGKNAYYVGHPCHIKECYEYDFNAAYGSAMYQLPSFIGASYKECTTLDDELVGVYEVSGRLKACPYGIFYNNQFQYYRLSDGDREIRLCVTSYELFEAIRSKEFVLNKVHTGWVLKPAQYATNPIREYIDFFWQKKNSTPKGDVKYLFWKLLLNSLYGKWIQRNPQREFFDGRLSKDDTFQWVTTAEKAGGLYHPFIATLVTGNVRARLHREEHKLDAIECSTDSVKSRILHKPYTKTHSLGSMQLESMFCKNCNIKTSSFDGLFLRNRLNLLMCECGEILKCALHGFWGKPDELKQLWRERRTNYTIARMPLLREGAKKGQKPLFQMYVEDRHLEIDWKQYEERKYVR